MELTGSKVVVLYVNAETDATSDGYERGENADVSRLWTTRGLRDEGTLALRMWWNTVTKTN